MKQELVRISKFMSLVLRHEPEKIGLNMDSEGWVSVEELINKINGHSSSKLKGTEKITKDIIDEVVDTNEKKRFAYNSDGTKIRASQGHSIDVDLKMSSVSPPEILFHGTASRFIHFIKKDGIKKMNRQHVHLSSTKSTAISVGSRHGDSCVIVVKSGDMKRDGFVFFMSENGVWLTDNVPSKYLVFEMHSR